MSVNESTTKEIIDPAFDYKKYPHLYGTYELSKITAQTGGQTVNVGVAGGIDSNFDIPAKVFNLSKSYLSFTISPDTPGVNPGPPPQYIYANMDGLTCIRQIQLMTRSGMYLCDINEVDKYTNMIFRRDNLSYDVETWDNPVPGLLAGTASGTFEGLSPCNTLATANYRYDGTAGKTNYVEPKYILPGAGLVLSPGINYRISLDKIKNTILAENKDLWFGGEILTLRIIWNAPSKTFFNSTNANTAANPVAYTGGFIISNLQFYLAIETDLLMENMVKSLVMRQEGLQLLVPMVYYNKVNIQPQNSHTVTTIYNRAQGIKLKKIYWAPYNITETADTAFDHSNLLGAKVTQFNTSVNNRRYSQYDYLISNYDDWLAKRKSLRGCALYSSNEYYYNWVYVEDFTDNNTLLHKALEKSDNFIEGLDLSTEQKIDIYATVPNIALNHYVYAVTSKLLTIGVGTINLI